MASKQAAKRLGKEYQSIQKDPPPFVFAKPNESNVLEWNFLMRGPPDTPYHGGEYYGAIVFPSDYPFAPPGLKMITPSGRFSPGAAICTSFSNFHPGSWNPAWSVQTILTGLLSFMLSDEITTGSIRATNAEIATFAAASHAWNISQAQFRNRFPEYATPTPRDLPNMGEKPSTALPMPPTPVNALLNMGRTPPDATSTGGTNVNTARLPPPDVGLWNQWRRSIGWTVGVLLVSWIVGSLWDA